MDTHIAINIFFFAIRYNNYIDPYQRVKLFYFPAEKGEIRALSIIRVASVFAY